MFASVHGLAPAEVGHLWPAGCNALCGPQALQTFFAYFFNCENIKNIQRSRPLYFSYMDLYFYASLKNVKFSNYQIVLMVRHVRAAQLFWAKGRIALFLVHSRAENKINYYDLRFLKSISKNRKQNLLS